MYFKVWNCVSGFFDKQDTNGSNTNNIQVYVFCLLGSSIGIVFAYTQPQILYKNHRKQLGVKQKK